MQLGDLLQVAKFEGTEISGAEQLRDLEAESTRLKKLLAEAVLDNATLKVVRPQPLAHAAPPL